jgi:hypothetical protein
MLKPPGSYLTGARVYNGGMNNPHSGTLDPSGYINREMKKRQSSRRSGLAETALRLQQHRMQNVDARPTATTPVHRISTATHTIQPSATGQYQAIPQTQLVDPNASNNVLPFDAQSAAQQILLQKQNDDFLNNLTQQRQQLASDITTKERNVDIEAPGHFRNVLNNFASRGMANSSGYGYQYGVTANDIANQKADLERQLQEGLAQYDYQQQNQADDYQLALAQLQAQTAETMPQDQYEGISGPQTKYQQVAKKIVKPKETSKKSTQAAAKRIVAKKKKGGKK